MGAASSLEPGDEGYEAPQPIEQAPSQREGLRSYDEMSDAECERLASIQGWKPLSVYHGPPGGFVGAREFLKKAETDTPILRAQNRRMTERLARVETEVTGLRGTVAEQNQMLTEIRAFARNANEEGYKRARAELEQKQDDAAANADQAGVRDARDKIRALDEGRREAPKPNDQQPRTDAPPPPNPELQREFAALKARELWVGRDHVLTTALIEIDKTNFENYPDMPIRERFDLSVAQVKRDFPQFFPSSRPRTTEEEIEETEVPAARPPAPPTRAQARPAPPGSRRQQAPDQNMIASIDDADDRAQAKLAFERWKRQFPDFTEAEYMQIYRNPKIDVRQLRQEAKKRG